MLQTIVLIVHVAAALMIIGLVLLQRGKGAEAGTGFGAGASGTVFGSRGSANFLSRTTGVLVAVFFATSLALTYLSTQRKAPTSLLEQTAPATSETQPAPAAVPPPAPAGETAPTTTPSGEVPELPTPPADAPPKPTGQNPTNENK
jgi:preprotein translocase subunit SecG